MLYTNLSHIETVEAYEAAVQRHQGVVVCCGRMEGTCIKVFEAMEELGLGYKHISFYDMEYDDPLSHVMRRAPMVSSLNELPFTAFYKKGEMVCAVEGAQTLHELKTLLDEIFWEGTLGQRTKVANYQSEEKEVSGKRQK